MSYFEIYLIGAALTYILILVAQKVMKVPHGFGLILAALFWPIYLPFALIFSFVLGVVFSYVKNSKKD